MAVYLWAQTVIPIVLVLLTVGGRTDGHRWADARTRHAVSRQCKTIEAVDQRSLPGSRTTTPTALLLARDAT